MPAPRHILLSFFLILTATFFALEQPRKTKYKRSGNGVRLNFGSSLNFYRVNIRHAVNPQQKLNATIGLRGEVRVIRDYKTYFLFGADYMVHGLSYQSYFFKPDSLKLYNKRFNYDYSLILNEIHIPLQLKYLLRREDNSLFSPYFLIGYHLRFLLPSNLKVSGDGKLLKDDSPDIRFKSVVFGEKVNASVSASLGWQKNNLSDNRGSFFAEINFQYGFSDYYFETDYSAASMFINCTHVTLLLGIKI